MPLALIAAGLAGLAIAFGLTAGRPRSDPAAQPAPVHGARSTQELLALQDELADARADADRLRTERGHARRTDDT